MKTVILVEFKEDLQKALALFSENSINTCIVALRPVVSYELDKLQCPYKTIRDYGASEERCDMGLKNFRLVHEISESLDQIMSPHLKNPAIKPGHYSFFYLKILFDVIMTKIHLLKLIISKEAADEIITFTHQTKIPSKIYPFNEDESVFAYLLKLPGWNIQVRIIASEIPEKNVQTNTQNSEGLLFRHKLFAKLKEIDFIFNLGIVFRKRGITQTLFCLKKAIPSKNKNHLVIFGSGYNWDYALPELVKSGSYTILRLNDVKKTEELFLHRREQIRKNVLESNSIFGISRYTKFCGIDFYEFASEKIISILSQVVSESEIYYNVSQAFFKEKQVKGLLVSLQATHEYRAVIQAAKDLEIPVMSWQHGGCGYSYHPMIVEAEFRDSDIHLVFGDEVKKSHMNTCLTANYICPEMVVIGSSGFDEEFSSIQKSEKTKNIKKVILYITEKFEFNLYYNSIPRDSTEICDIFWDIQSKFLNFVADNQDYEFIFKFHPAESNGEPGKSYAKDKNIKNIRFIVNERTIQELLPSADVIIIDFPATCILEVLLTKKPVFFYQGIYPLDPKPLLLLKKRAFTYDNFCDLCKDVNILLKEGQESFGNRKGINYTNTEFLQSFGTFKNDKNSAIRACIIVDNILKNN